MIVVDYDAYAGSWFDCSCLTACLRVVTLTALQTAGVFLSCVHDYRFFFVRRRQYSREQPNAALGVFRRNELVGRGNRGSSDAVVEWILAAMLLQFAD